MEEVKTFNEWISGYIQENIEFKKSMFRLKNWIFEEYTKYSEDYSFALKCTKCKMWANDCKCINNIK